MSLKVAAALEDGLRDEEDDDQMNHLIRGQGEVPHFPANYIMSTRGAQLNLTRFYQETRMVEGVTRVDPRITLITITEVTQYQQWFTHGTIHWV